MATTVPVTDKKHSTILQNKCAVGKHGAFIIAADNAGREQALDAHHIPDTNSATASISASVIFLATLPIIPAGSLWRSPLRKSFNCFTR